MVKKADLDNMGKMTATPGIKDGTIVAIDETYCCRAFSTQKRPLARVRLRIRVELELLPY